MGYTVTGESWLGLAASLPGLKIEIWATQSFSDGQTCATRRSVMLRRTLHLPRQVTPLTRRYVVYLMGWSAAFAPARTAPLFGSADCSTVPTFPPLRN